jgi:hypothetical protein
MPRLPKSARSLASTLWIVCLQQLLGRPHRRGVRSNVQLGSAILQVQLGHNHGDRPGRPMPFAESGIGPNLPIAKSRPRLGRQ